MSLKDSLQGPVPDAEVTAAEDGGDGAAPTTAPGDALPVFVHAEAAVCEKLAVARRRVAGWRKIGALQKGLDWDFAGGVVHYAECGVEKAARLLSGEMPLPVLAAVKKDRAALVDVRVTGSMVNPVMVWAETPEKTRLKVRVRLARKFVPGMVLAVRLVEPDLAVYEGPEPRWAKDPQFWRQFPAV